MKQEARFWKPNRDNAVQCQLCPHTCTIKPGKHGVCGVRENQSGKLYTLIYGMVSSMAVDPIEKKPLYHFHPGTHAFSLGSVGCTFRCDHCQNFSISAARPDSSHLREVSPEEAVALAVDRGCEGISWTYNEPTIWHEYSVDTSKVAKKQGLYTTYVTNGYINEEPLRELAPFLDAMNIDVKAFTDDFYRRICKARLDPVLRTCELAKQLGIHVEVTYLVIPGLNDSLDEVRGFCSWVVEALGVDTPVHFTRFHPDYKMTNVPMTPIETLKQVVDVARDAGIVFPYMGNVLHSEYENTICPGCGAVCVERYGFEPRLRDLKEGCCVRCGTSLSMVMK
jgi:pyruvate formate lyase activating enzyme